MTCALFGHKEWKKDASSAWIFFEWHRKFELCATNFWKGKVHIFWEGHKILQNLHLTFVLCSACRRFGEEFAKFCGLLRIYELQLSMLCIIIRKIFTRNAQYIPMRFHLGTIHLRRLHVLWGGGVSPWAAGQKVTVHKDQKSPS